MLARIGTWLRRYWWTGPLVVLAIAAVWAVLWPLSDALATHDVAGYAAAKRPGHLQSAREAVRTQLLTLGAGVFAAGALFYTARNFALSRQQARDTAEAERRTLELTEQGQVTDRYTKAIEQLGSDKLDVRIGGIYALERIARDSARDHPTVIEVLSAFIREHSHERPPPPPDSSAPPNPDIRPDVQAAVTVLGRRKFVNDSPRINLSGANLSHADLETANLADAVLWDVNLTRADMRGAILTSADLTQANLTGALLVGADFAGVKLVEAVLSATWWLNAILVGAEFGPVKAMDANFERADLSQANLAGGRLDHADFTHAKLCGADLREADLSTAALTGADFTDADLRQADLHAATLTGANFRGAELTDAWFPSNAAPDGWEIAPSGRLARVGAS